MTRIYLDVHDRVRVDTTEDHHLAEKASSDRFALSFLARLERLGEHILEINLERGRDTRASINNLATVHAFRREVLKKAE